jgi:hypothetical protein
MPCTPGLHHFNFKVTGDRMNLAWRTAKVAGDLKKVTRDHLNLSLRTVKVIGRRFHPI